MPGHILRRKAIGKDRNIHSGIWGFCFHFLADENGLKSLVPFMLLGCSKTQSIQSLGQLWWFKGILAPDTSVLAGLVTRE